ncbi:MAG: efflux RND transporter permease subunit [Myxococcales bacterium]|nr:efflux RND transporter permease subunit [Myxococcales bacterium]MCB9520275.1 efflux RND transporter permease subunit [Myxococcales bacterium]MCB9531357.1 efflux RND transporter permease subunit [Myxococcales bacterium]MCB9533570.1 efflux RND transporter permease subunit [Myxococcales bacterium]
MSAAQDVRGAVAWMASNPVAANVAMVMLLAGGLVAAPTIRQEVFPEFTLDTITVTVPYPGASPSEVEQGVVLPVEEAVRGLDGIKTVTATASESVGSVTVELLTGVNRDAALADIKSAVDRITLFPQDAERPVVAASVNRQENIRIVLHGDVDERELRRVAVDMREALLARGEVTLVELSGVRPPEIGIEVSESSLRQYGLTIEAVAAAVRQASVDLPAGGLRTPAGEVLLRTTERRDVGPEFEDIVIRANTDGSLVRVRDVAHVDDGFRETDQSARFNGERAAILRVFRVGDQTPIGVTDHVRAFLEEVEPTLPSGISVDVVNDRSEIYRDRISLLLRNARMGLVLVLLVLGAFLELKLAFWVTLGIPISFLGAMFLMPVVGASLNMISLFAFILTLGIVVDDAIVIGESVYHHRSLGKPPLQAAIDGAREVSGPVVFSVLTTVIAFVPIMFIPGTMGKFMGVIPVIVITILMISLFESLFILPAHLAHTSGPFRGGLLGALEYGQEQFGRLFDFFVARVFEPAVRFAYRARYLTIALGVCTLVLTVGVVKAGKIQFTFMPRIEGDIVTATLEMPFGTPADATAEVVERLEREARALLDENRFHAEGDEDGAGAEIGRGIYAEVGSAAQFGGARSSGGSAASHLGSVTVFMVPIDHRDIGAQEFTRRWRQRVGDVPGIESLTFRFSTGPSSGSPVDVQLSHSDMAVLEAAAADLAERLRSYAGVVEIDDGFSAGKEQLDLTLTDEGRAHGLTEESMARQVRSAFFGSEAVRQQRGRDELRVYVRRPLEERQSEYWLDNLLLRAPDGTEVPLRVAAHIERGSSYTSIRREDGRRVVSVTADVETSIVTADDVNASIRADLLHDLVARYPGLSATMGGEAREQGETMDTLRRGMLLALLAMYALMAVALKSAMDPLLIMLAIPFGFVGAINGHVALGYSLSLMSMFGLVALAGVVVNDAIVLIDAINTYRRETVPFEAVVQAACRRLRPIMLTSLTTFFGLAPMLLEKSVQARFLIPMAISLAFGVMFSTMITLVFVPSTYLALDDLQRALRWIGGALGFVDSAAGPEHEGGRDWSPRDERATTADDEQGDGDHT